MDTITTIKNIDCYGQLRIGNSVEVIPSDSESFLVDNDSFTSWSVFIAWTADRFPGLEIAELVADN